jgi:hypothetical protein
MEIFQGDDALVVLGGWISKQEVAKQYARLQLEVHHEKTWVTKGNTEYLHEVYLFGRVVAFPARAFRAVAWRKPLTNLTAGEYGVDRFNSLVNSVRMACRRGLHCVDILRRVVKSSFEGFDEAKFQAWLCTPYIFGGFGFGTSGRIALVGTSQKVKDFKVRIRGAGKLKREWRTAAISRVRDRMPVPGIRSKYRWDTVVGDAEMPPSKLGKYGAFKPPMVDWTLRNLVSVKDAYKRKLHLEWKLQNGYEILDSDLPGYFGDFDDLDRAYRTYRRLVSRVIGMESVFTSGETFFRLREWGNRVWAGICYQWTRIDGPDKMKGQLCRTIHNMSMEKNFRRYMVRVLV